MRIAPLAFLLDPNDTRDRTIIRDVCRITHHNDEAYVGALAVVLAIRSALSETWSEHQSFLAATVGALPDSAVRDRMIAILALQSQPAETSHIFGATSYVVDTVPLAMYCAQFIASESLPAVLARGISGGGDTDTLASIAGQLAGTVVGSAGVPPDLVADIEDSSELTMIVQAFANFVEENRHLP